MSIEDKLRSFPVRSRVDHKAELRHALVIAEKGATTKAHNRMLKKPWVTLTLVPVMAVAVLVSLTIWQPKTDNVFVQQLTAQQVFAEAEKQYLESLLTPLKPGEAYYQKFYTWSVSGNKGPVGDDCMVAEGVTEWYTAANGVIIKVVNYNFEGKLWAVTTYAESGEPGAENYIDNSLKLIQSTTCPQWPDWTGYDNTKQSEATRQFNELFISSGRPEFLQTKEAYERVKQYADWTVKMDVTIDKYDGKVIEMIPNDPNRPDHLSLYFDQETKQYVGSYNGSNSIHIILERGIREVPIEPQYNGPVIPGVG